MSTTTLNELSLDRCSIILTCHKPTLVLAPLHLTLSTSSKQKLDSEIVKVYYVFGIRKGFTAK
jgi:hypothetical protein